MTVEEGSLISVDALRSALEHLNVTAVALGIVPLLLGGGWAVAALVRTPDEPERLAFAAVVNSLVENLLMPVIAMIIGKPDFSGLDFTINDAVFRYGAFITELIQFLAIAAAVFFFVVKPVQAMLARARREPIEEGMPDEERRHQELLAAIERLGAR